MPCKVTEPVPDVNSRKTERKHSTMINKPYPDRRTVLKATGGLLSLACVSGITTAKGHNYGNGNAIGAFLNEDAEFKDPPLWSSGISDETGRSEVDVTVGAITGVDIPENLAPPGEEVPEELPMAFAPKAVKVSPATEVIWKWAPGIHHSVTSLDGTGVSFDEHGESGYQFSHTFDEVGNYLYYCIPHGTPYTIDFGGPVGEVDNLFGMRGVVKVSDE